MQQIELITILNYNIIIIKFRASQVVMVVKSSHVVQKTQETPVGSLCREDPLEEEIATHSSILAWRIP